MEIDSEILPENQNILHDKPFCSGPTKDNVKLEPQAKMTSSCTRTEIRQCDTLSWRLDRLSSEGKRRWQKSCIEGKMFRRVAYKM